MGIIEEECICEKPLIKQVAGLRAKNIFEDSLEQSSCMEFVLGSLSTQPQQIWEGESGCPKDLNYLVKIMRRKNCKFSDPYFSYAELARKLTRIDKAEREERLSNTFPSRGIWKVVDSSSCQIASICKSKLGLITYLMRCQANSFADYFPTVYNRFGIYVVRLKAHAVAKEVVVDDKLLYEQKEKRYWPVPPSNNQLYPTLLAKAWHKSVQNLLDYRPYIYFQQLWGIPSCEARIGQRQLSQPLRRNYKIVLSSKGSHSLVVDCLPKSYILLSNQPFSRFRASDYKFVQKKFLYSEDLFCYQATEQEVKQQFEVVCFAREYPKESGRHFTVSGNQTLFISLEKDTGECVVRVSQLFHGLLQHECSYSSGYLLVMDLERHLFREHYFEPSPFNYHIDLINTLFDHLEPSRLLVMFKMHWLAEGIRELQLDCFDEARCKMQILSRQYAFKQLSKFFGQVLFKDVPFRSDSFNHRSVKLKEGHLILLRNDSSRKRMAKVVLRQVSNLEVLSHKSVASSKQIQLELMVKGGIEAIFLEPIQRKANHGFEQLIVTTID